MIKQPIKGMRDILPKTMQIREFLLNSIKEVYTSFGFELIETPIVEHIENLLSSDGAENEKLIYKILKRGEKLEESILKGDITDSGLRYDLTVPLARYFGKNLNDLSLPFKAFQFGSVFRAERPQKWRFRQFMQVDIDIIGDKSTTAEIDLLLATIAFFEKIEFSDYYIVINSREILKQAILYTKLDINMSEKIYIILDKLDKIGIEKVKEELFTICDGKEEEINRYLFLNRINDLEEYIKTINLDDKVYKSIKEIIDIVYATTGVKLIFDPTLVRGMGYYTGLIFEIRVKDIPVSLGGGGRYDKMIEKYVNLPYPAVGISVGFERLAFLLEENECSIKNGKKKIAILIANDELDDEKKSKFALADELREQGIIVKIVSKNKNVKRQIELLNNEGYEVK
jgi:histidyl-tRNA synthetase